MKRREFITLIGGGVALGSLTAGAQQSTKLRRIEFLAGGVRPTPIEGTLYEGFPQGMRQRGYVEGKDFVIEWRFAEGKYERFSDFAAEMVSLQVDAIVLGTPAAIRSVQEATSTIPIIMGFSTDPVGNGFVASLSHPGGNTTGLASSTDDTVPKQLDILAMVVPRLRHFGFLANPDNPSYSLVLRNVKNAAQQAGFNMRPYEARSFEEIESAFTKLANERVEAVMVISDALFFSHRRRIAELALEHRLASIFVLREYAAAGGLLSFGENLQDFFRRAATFVDKVFKGAKPADLPIEQPTRFNLVINLKTAKALGLDVPDKLLVIADEIIE
jgi:putative tryptophan/tyrosine transport system substrate-binding protein